MSTSSPATQCVVERNRIRPDEVDLFIPHQATPRIIEAVAKRLRVPAEPLA